MPDTAFALTLPPDLLRPLVQEIVKEVVDQLEAAKAQTGGTTPGLERMAYGEAEAARMIGLNVNQLRGERVRGRIAASRIVGRKVRYLREDLVQYLMAHRTQEA